MVATLTRIFGLEHLDLVEDVVQEAFVKALRRWPYHGAPANRSAWILQAAKNGALDVLRRRANWRSKASAVERALRPAEDSEPAGDPTFAGELRDDQIKLIFACCHPVLSRDAQVALTLKTVGGFSVSEVARAFLARETTVAQRLVRAKRRLRRDRVGLEIPSPAELSPRLDAVLEVLYLMFNEGYSALEGEDLVRHDLCHEAIRLGRLLAAHPQVGDLAAGRAEADALSALMLFQAARLPARTDAQGNLVRLADQDRSLWDRAAIHAGVVHLRRSARGPRLTTYHLQAEIASCHALSAEPETTDWQRILGLYDTLYELQPTPVVALNRAVAVAEAVGPDAGLEALDRLAGEAALDAYHPYHAARGELLTRLGRHRQASEAFRAAVAATRSLPVRRFLQARLADEVLPGEAAVAPVAGAAETG